MRLHGAIKYLFLIGLCLILIWQAHQGIVRQFCFKNIYVEGLAPEETPLSMQELETLQEVFKQKFSYLDRGKQSFAFISADQRYVLKFFDAFGLDSPKKSKKLARLIQGYQTAKVYDSDYAGLIFVQLAPNPLINLIITVEDRFGFFHRLDLSQMPFVIQRKAIPLRVLLTDLLQRGDLDQVKKRLKTIFEMYIEEYSRGLYDRDHNFMYNTGFDGEHPMRIDVGRLRIAEEMKNPEVFNKDLKKITFQRLGDWMGRHFPLYRDKILAEVGDFNP